MEPQIARRMRWTGIGLIVVGGAVVVGGTALFVVRLMRDGMSELLLGSLLTPVGSIAAVIVGITFVRAASTK